ncbi:MAG: rRNA adenine N-6-methyltransferase family protein [Ruminococcus sp.]
MMINLTDMKTVRSILSRHGFHFSKKLGQNFLVDPSVCPRIAEEGNAAPGFGVLEIGPGIGTLTQQLALRAEGYLCGTGSASPADLEETVGEFDNLTFSTETFCSLMCRSCWSRNFPECTLQSAQICRTTSPRRF